MAQQPTLHRLMRPLLWSVLIAIALYAAMVVFGEIETLGGHFTAVGWSGWLTLLALSLLSFGLRFARWHYYQHHLGHHLGIVHSTLCYLGGFAFTTTPGKAGEAVRSIYLKRVGISYSESLAMLFTERLLDLAAMIILAMEAAYAFPSVRWPVLIMGVIMVLLLPTIHSTRLRDWLGKASEATTPGATPNRLRRAGRHLANLLQWSSRLLQSRVLYGGLTLGVIAWGAQGLAFYLVLDYLGAGVGMVVAIGIYAVSMLAGAVSFLPGGLGTTEAVMGILLLLIGIDTPTAVAATLICRLTTLWFAVAIGLLALAILEWTGQAPRRPHPDSRWSNYKD